MSGSDYAPANRPLINNPELEDILRAVWDEFFTLQRVINDRKILLLAESNEAPDKPRDGMIVLADGTNWDPGSGQGYYGYYNSAWNKLG